MPVRAVLKQSPILLLGPPSPVTSNGKRAARAQFRLYHFVGTGFAGKQYVHLYSSFARTLQKTTTRRADTRKGDGHIKTYKHKLYTRIESVHATPFICLYVVLMYDGTVASAEVPIENSMSDVVVDDMIENETQADFYVVEL